MSDFGELCPLFSTGVFNEITFPQLAMTGFSATAVDNKYGNALLGTLTFTKSNGYFTFGRTVVVTGAFVRRNKTSDSGGIQRVCLVKFTRTPGVYQTGESLGTVLFSVTSDGVGALTWIEMTVAAKTFTSSDILGFSMVTGTALSAGTYDLIVRYKEK